jgi:hypothetical protein
MAPRKAERPTRKQAETERFESRTQRDPLGALQPDTDAEFTADGKIPRAQESSKEYVERVGHSDRRGKPSKAR